MVVTIDGPAGAGKSSVARKLAEQLGFAFLDTGAMYRAITVTAMRREIDLSNSGEVEHLACSLEIQLLPERICVDGDDVTAEIRSGEVTRNIHYVADLPSVRGHLNAAQRKFADGKNIVTEGRDQGTEVFPDAECKIFLTASPEERARRRQQQLERNGHQVELEQILAEQDKRDQQDADREMGRLHPAVDATTVSTDGMHEQAVISKLEEIVRLSMS